MTALQTRGPIRPGGAATKSDSTGGSPAPRARGGTRTRLTAREHNNVRRARRPGVRRNRPAQAEPGPLARAGDAALPVHHQTDFRRTMIKRAGMVAALAAILALSAVGAASADTYTVRGCAAGWEAHADT